jgi:hypothetical protein
LARSATRLARSFKARKLSAPEICVVMSLRRDHALLGNKLAAFSPLLRARLIA